jgi:hypothetical protein
MESVKQLFQYDDKHIDGDGHDKNDTSNDQK